MLSDKVGKKRPLQDKLATSDNQTNESQKTQVVGTNGIPISADGITNALQTITYEHHEIHAGSHFMICSFETVANGGSVDFVVETPDTAKWLHMSFEIEGTSRTEIHIYEDVDANADGTTATPYNNNRNSNTTSGAVVRKNPTINDTGTLIFSQSKGLEGTNQSKTGNEGITKRGREIVLKQNSKYLFRITSRDDGNIISYCGEWYEHSNN